MKSILITLVFLLTFSSYSIAQQNHSASITGIVLSTSGEVLMGTNIMLTGTTFGTSTNLDGQFSLNNLADGSYEIRVSYVGYQFERAFEQRLNDDLTSPQSGILRDDEIRIGHRVFVPGFFSI